MQEHRRVLREYVDSRASFADLLAALEEHRTSAATPDPTALDALHILGEASTAGWADDDLRAELRELLAEPGVGILITDLAGTNFNSVGLASAGIRIDSGATLTVTR